MESSREVLFRGKRVDTKEWAYGYYFMGFTGIPYILVLHDHILRMTEFYEIIPETLGQSTGFFDYGGKKIFEGDILCANTGVKWDNGIHSEYLQYAQVVYNDQKARFEILGKMGESHKALDQVVNKCRALLCGNIHDNKELINGV